MGHFVLEHRRSFRLFVKLDCCIYVLRKAKAVAPCALGLFPWEERCSWHEQWARQRPALVVFGKAQNDILIRNILFYLDL